MLGGALLAFVAFLIKLLVARAAQVKARARLQSL
jgi:hypothetical protein